MIHDRIEESKKFFATMYAFTLYVQGMHWNVKGPHFFALHDFFEDVYTDLSTEIDPMAERIRYFNDYPPSTLAALTQYNQIEDMNTHDMDASKMVDLFLKSAHIIVRHGQSMLPLFEDDAVTHDHYVHILAKLDIHIWKARMYQDK